MSVDVKALSALQLSGGGGVSFVRERSEDLSHHHPNTSYPTNRMPNHNNYHIANNQHNGTNPHLAPRRGSGQGANNERLGQTTQTIDAKAEAWDCAQLAALNCPKAATALSESIAAADRVTSEEERRRNNRSGSAPLNPEAQELLDTSLKDILVRFNLYFPATTGTPRSGESGESGSGRVSNGAGAAYREKTNSEDLFFEIEEAYWFYCDFFHDKHPDTLPAFTLKEFARQVFDRSPSLLLPDENYVALYEKFVKFKTRIPKCGAVLLQPDLTQIALIMPWVGHSWQFPRGKLKRGETEEESAAREVFEETGFDIKGLVRPEEKIVHTSAGGKGNVILFIVTGTPADTKFEPQTRKEVRCVKWHCIETLFWINENKSRSDTAKHGLRHFGAIVPFLWELKRFVDNKHSAKGQFPERRRQVAEELERKYILKCEPTSVVSSPAASRSSTPAPEERVTPVLPENPTPGDLARFMLTTCLFNSSKKYFGEKHSRSFMKALVPGPAGNQ